MRESVGALAAVAVAFSLVGTAICRADAPGVENALPTIFRRMTAEPYELDAHPRYVDGAKFRCPQPETVAYRGTTIRYRPTVRVHRAFRERLERFEALVAKVGKRYYGRAPFRLVHSGGFNCRRVRGSSVRISEHALGNALDLRGFDFPHIGARASKRLLACRGGAGAPFACAWPGTLECDATP
ncbi:MAG: extensin family protein [Polyangiales bacterium]